MILLLVLTYLIGATFGVPQRVKNFAAGCVLWLIVWWHARRSK
jgi:hypothetical protein